MQAIHRRRVVDIFGETGGTDQSKNAAAEHDETERPPTQAGCSAFWFLVLLFSAWWLCANAPPPAAVPIEQMTIEHQLITHGDWTLLDQVGSGGYGEVYAARNDRTGRVFAVKKMFLARGYDENKPGVRERVADKVSLFQREVAILKDLEHPNVVRYLGHSIKEDSFFLYLEYVPGSTLYAVMDDYYRRRRRGATIDTALAQNYVSQILKALAFLHKNGIIHRDIKPENIMVTPDGTVKLVDFGTAFDMKDFQRTPKPQTMLGTAPYVAPETYYEQPHTTASDIWSLGVTCFQLFTGLKRTPFIDDYVAYNLSNIAWDMGLDNSDAIVQLHDEVGWEVQRWPDDMHPYVRNLLANMLVRDWTTRSTAEELLQHRFFDL